MARQMMQRFIWIPTALAFQSLTAGTLVASDGMQLVQVSPLTQQGQLSAPQAAPSPPQVAPGAMPNQQAQIKLSNELRTVQAVERMEQTLTAMAARMRWAVDGCSLVSSASCFRLTGSL